MNFFAYREPGKHVIAYCSAKLIDGFSAGGFVVAPFLPQNSEIFTIPCENEISINNISSLLSGCKHSAKTIYEFPAKSVDKQKHIANIESTIESICLNEIDKCVIARTEVVESKIDITQTFNNLCEAYPDAFVFLFHTEESGLWMGATPELLLTRDGSRLESMALAGTRLSKTDRDWDEKNINEQRIVTDYIVAAFCKAGVNPKIEGPDTKIAGPVEHLCSSIIGEIDSKSILNQCDFNNSILKLIDSLSPTPALCGYPRNNALRNIAKLENFERGYYGGFIGMICSDWNFKLYVNLRSMRIEENRYSLFAGGGIMKDSIATEEWIETERKMATLKALIVNQ